MFGAEHFHKQNDLRIKRKYTGDLVESVVFSLELGLILHQDWRPPKESLLWSSLSVGVHSPPPLQILRIVSPPHLPLPPFSYQLGIWMFSLTPGSILITWGQLWGLFGAEWGLESTVFIFQVAAGDGPVFCSKGTNKGFVRGRLFHRESRFPPLGALTFLF